QYLDAAELVFGELLGNVARYAPGPIEIIFDWGEGAPVLHVLDRGPGFKLAPKLPSDLLSEQGRGLYLVWSLAEDFNVTERYDGGSHARAVLNTGSSAVGWG
ncbi:MAG: ATP-binding protein, partial [Candidatus Cybelea sp.]